MEKLTAASLTAVSLGLFFLLALHWPDPRRPADDLDAGRGLGDVHDGRAMSLAARRRHFLDDGRALGEGPPV